MDIKVCCVVVDVDRYRVAPHLCVEVEAGNEPDQNVPLELLDKVRLAEHLASEQQF